MPLGHKILFLQHNHMVILFSNPTNFKRNVDGSVLILPLFLSSLNLFSSFF